MVQYWSNSPVLVSGNKYIDLLKGAPSVRTPLPEFLAGIERPSQSGFTVSNANKEITDLKKTDLLRGKRVIIEEQVEIDGVKEVNSWYHGIVDSTAISEVADFNLEIQDLNILRRDFPVEIVDTAKFPNVIDDDAGRAVPYVIGTAKKVPLANIKSQESPSVQYQYLVGRGDLTVDVVYRDGLVVQSFSGTAQAGTVSSITLDASHQKDDDFFNDAFIEITGGTGSGQTRKIADYAGPTNVATPDTNFATAPDNTSTYVIREWKKITVTVNSVDYTAIEFAIPQKFNDQILTSRRMAADVTGLQTERNPAKALETILGFFTTAISASDFTSAETEINNIGDLFIDGAMTEQRPALEWIDQICKIGRMLLRIDDNRDFKPIVIGTQSTVYGTFRDDRNIVDISPSEEVPWSDLVGELTVRYRKQFDSGNFRITSGIHTVVSGAEGKEQLDFDLIFDKTTADKVADFLAKALRAQDEVIPIKLPYEARQRQNLDLIQFHDTALERLNIYQIIETQPVGDGFNFRIIPYPAYLTTYEAGNPAPGSITDPVTDSTADFRKTPAEAVSNLAVSWTVTSLNVSATAHLTWDNPSENYTEALVEFKKSSDSLYTSAGRTSASKFDIPGADTGINYDFRITSFSNLSEVDGGVAELNNQTAAGDNTAPADPTGLAVEKESFAEVTWKFDAPTENDYRRTNYRIWSASSGGSLLLPEDSVVGNTVKATLQDSGALTSIETGWIEIQHEDFSGNTSAWSSRVRGDTKAISTDDINPDNVTGKTSNFAINQSISGVFTEIHDIFYTKQRSDTATRIEMQVEVFNNNASGLEDFVLMHLYRGGSKIVDNWAHGPILGQQSATFSPNWDDDIGSTGTLEYRIVAAAGANMDATLLRLRVVEYQR